TPGDLHPSITAPTDHDKLQLILAVSSATLQLAKSCPTLLIVDDLHWADRQSLDLFEHLAFTVADVAQREPIPIVIVGTFRTVATAHRLARLVERLELEQSCRTLDLRGLSETEVLQLIEGLGLKRASHQLTATVSEA